MKLKNVFIFLFLLSIILISIPKVRASTESTNVIVLSNEQITVGGEEISQDTTNAVYVSYKTEVNDDIAQNVQNTVINITKAGTYEFNGSIENAQIAIKASEEDEVTIILNGVTISCDTAPAIIVYSAKDTKTAGQAGVHFVLAQNSTNKIVGSHIPDDASYIENGTTYSYENDYDGAISSDISIEFSGSGKLIVDSDNEGIETKLHLTINSGDYEIYSCDDAINASEDSISVITINDGTIYANIKDTAKEGDGIDSNGYIYINGGTVYAFASETSQDSGLDSDLGIYINGGYVVATGNMADEVSNDSEQPFLQIQFSTTQNGLITVLDENETPIVAFESEKSYQVLVISTNNLKDDTNYTIYSDGQIEGTSKNGLYTEITSYEKGTKQTQTTTGSNGMKTNMNMPQDMQNKQTTNNNSIIGIMLILGGILLCVIVIVTLVVKYKKL